MVLDELIMLGWINYAVCYLLIDASILDKPRQVISGRLTRVGEMLECYFCTGFWTGLVLYLNMIHVWPGCFSQWAMLFASILGLAAASNVMSLIVFRLGYVAGMYDTTDEE